MINVVGVHHLAVLVRDLDRAERFYVGVLGLPVLERHRTDTGLHRSTWVALGSTAFLALERAAPTEPPRRDDAPGWHCVALRIDLDAREAWRTRLGDAGHPVEHETLCTLYTRDPDGSLVALSHHPQEHSPTAK